MFIHDIPYKKYHYDKIQMSVQAESNKQRASLLPERSMKAPGQPSRSASTKGSSTRSDSKLETQPAAGPSRSPRQSSIPRRSPDVKGKYMLNRLPITKTPASFLDPTGTKAEKSDESPSMGKPTPQKKASTFPKSETRAPNHLRRPRQDSILSRSASSRSTAAVQLLSSRATGHGRPMSKAVKPEFSVKQQRYSPKRKDPTSIHQEKIASKLFPGVSTKDITELQAELLQLHILHRSAHKTQQEWKMSAQTSLRHRFEELQTRQEEIKEVSHQQRALLNQFALSEWSQGHSSTDVAEKIEQLSQNIAEVDALLDVRGRYVHVLRVFESWYNRAREILNLRSSETNASTSESCMIEGIGDGWKAGALVLERELTYSLRDFKAFGVVRGTSSLSKIILLHETLVSNMLEELDLIQWIEHELMERESTWVEQRIDILTSQLGAIM